MGRGEANRPSADDRQLCQHPRQGATASVPCHPHGGVARLNSASPIMTGTSDFTSIIALEMSRFHPELPFQIVPSARRADFDGRRSEKRRLLLTSRKGAYCVA